MSKKQTITSEKFQLGTGDDPIRFSFLELVKPKKFDEESQGDPKFQATALLDPTNKKHAEQLANLNALMKDLLARGGVDAEELLSKCVGKGDKKKHDGYKGMIYVQLANKDRPIIGNRAGALVAPGEKGFPYSGAFGIIKGTFWLQDNRYGKRINGNLLSIQFIKDGPAFSGARQLDPEEEFEKLPDEKRSSAPSKGVTQASDDDFLS